MSVPAQSQQGSEILNIGGHTSTLVSLYVTWPTNPNDMSPTPLVHAEAPVAPITSSSSWPFTNGCESPESQNDINLVLDEWLISSDTYEPCLKLKLI